MQIRLEVEYWTVERDGSLATADPVAADCEFVDREFADPLVEVKTPPCESVAALARTLGNRLATVREVARSHGLWLVPLGTPLTPDPVARRRSDRIDVQRAVLGDALDHAARCAGTHVHFEQVDAAEQLRVLTALDPAIALVNTSPYYRGRRLATCARPHAYRRLCYGAAPELGQLWKYPESAAAWRDRVENCYERFVASATDRPDTDREAVDAAFSPADAVWTPVRLRDDLGTVEWRAPDAAPPLAVCRLVADAERLVRAAVERGTAVGTDDGGDRLALPSFDRLRDLVDAAVAAGLSAPAVASYLDGLGVDTDAYRPPGARIDGRRRVGASAAKRLRRRAADALLADLEALRADGLDALSTGDEAVPA
ncbi:glutamate-cysteine ligase family protein [Halosimplex halophilum]|uniref:glutamate-cysteine ligase family protein n=1 Tax=Halosimplex halophilum TaxID=2559572 RepID=UPI00107EF423|nr:glutamate-cysteine ligase family protein [Halosimplex halophilum]